MLGQIQILSFRGIEDRVNTFVKSHNNLNEGLSESIRISRKAALRNIVNAYRNFIYDFKNNISWETATEIPEMKMNRKVISRMVGCCLKTSYNHVSFLVESGVLVKELHGRQNDFGLYLNPYFWISECVKLPSLVLKKGNKTEPFPLSLGNFLPPISIQKIQQINNYYKAELENVEKVGWETSKTNAPHFQADISDDYSEKSNKQCTVFAQNLTYPPISAKNEGLAAGAELSTTDSTLSTNMPVFGVELQKEVQKLKDKSNGTSTVGGNESLITSEVPPQSSSLTENEVEAWKLVKKFTDYALTNIYQSNRFNQNFFVNATQYTEIKNLIMSDVFGNFTHAANDVWRIRQAYTDAIFAVDKAIANAEKNNWTSFLHPKCYFSQRFMKQGKKGTFFEAMKWQKEDKNKIHEVKISEIIERAKHHVIFEKSPRGRKDLTTRLQISQHFRVEIAKKCGAYHASLFNQFLSNPTNFK